MANGIIFRVLPISSVTASTTAFGYHPENVTEDYMGTVWRSATGSATQTLTIDLGEDTAFDTITLHGLAGATTDWQWQIELATEAQGAFTGAHFDGVTADLLAGANFPVHGRGRALWMASDETSPPASARYIRITFSAIDSGAVQVSRVCIGQDVGITRNFALGAAFGVRSFGQVDYSSRGTLLRRKAGKKRGLGVSLDHESRAVVEASIQPLLEQCGNDEPVVIVFDPEPDAERQNRIYFGLLTGDLGTVWAKVGGFTTQFNLVAED